MIFLAALLLGETALINAQDLPASNSANTSESSVKTKEPIGGAPIGGGVSILVTLGLAFGINRIIVHRRSTTDMT